MSKSQLSTIGYSANQLATISITAKNIKRDLCFAGLGDHDYKFGTNLADACEEIVYQANLLEQALREMHDKMKSEL